MPGSQIAIAVEKNSFAASLMHLKLRRDIQGRLEKGS